jgi:REP element-mobilizing transposase RayT
MNTKPLEVLYPQRRHIRLSSYDYTWQGAYFITICTYEKQCLFGNIVESSMKLNPCGEIVQLCWKDIPIHYHEVTNEVFIVMPNHVHGIISIHNANGRSGSKPDPTRKHPLSEIVRAFKTYSSRGINEHRNSQGTSVWQRSYYEHVIRSESEYQQIGEYIVFNAAKWETDRENPNTRLKTPPLPFEH